LPLVDVFVADAVNQQRLVLLLLVDDNQPDGVVVLRAARAMQLRLSVSA
jgi:hypothetical protein